MTAWIGLMTGLLMAACGGCQMASEPKTGIEGRILKGPMCPGPVRLDRPCPNQPAEASFLVKDENGRVAARFQTDAAGMFRVAVKPGIYHVVPLLGADLPPLFGRQEVTVPAQGWCRVEWHFDTGMR